jgi:regulator of sigma E protease
MPKSALLYPKNASKEISFIEPNSPAQQAGFKEGDLIVSINHQPMDTAVEIVTYIRNHPVESIDIGIIRNGNEESITLTTGEKNIQDKSIGYIGIDFLIPTYGLIDSIKQGISSTHTLIVQVGSAFKMMFADRKIENLGGPLMVISQTIKGAEKGVKIFLLLLAFISVNLAVLNLIPLPIMDGGQILFYSIEAIIGRPLPDKVRITIHYICWIGVLALVAFLSIKDVIRMFFTH